MCWAGKLLTIAGAGKEGVSTRSGGGTRGGTRGGRGGRGGVQNKTEGRRTGPRRHRVVWHRRHCGRHILGAENKEARVCTTRVTYCPGEDWPTCQSVGRVCRWRRRSDHTDMRERQWRPQARRRAWGVHVDHDIYMPESMERVWSLARVERRRGSDGREGRMWILYE